MSLLKIENSEQEGVAILRLGGSADMDEARSLSQQLMRLQGLGKFRLVLDLENLNFISSMGLGGLIQAHRECQKQGGSLALVNPAAAVLKIFRTTRLDSLFQICKTVQEAVTLCREAPGPEKPAQTRTGKE